MASVEFTENMTEDQLEAIAGGEALRYQATAFGVTRNNKVSDDFHAHSFVFVCLLDFILVVRDRLLLAPRPLTTASFHGWPSLWNRHY